MKNKFYQKEIYNEHLGENKSQSYIKHLYDYYVEAVFLYRNDFSVDDIYNTVKIKVRRIPEIKNVLSRDIIVRFLRVSNRNKLIRYDMQNLSMSLNTNQNQKVN